MVRSKQVVLMAALLMAVGAAQATAEAQSLTGQYVNNGALQRYTPHSGVQLLKQFVFSYQAGNDNHISKIRVAPESPDWDYTTLWFGDGNPTQSDDTFAYDVAFEDVTTPGIQIGSYVDQKCTRGSCSYVLNAPGDDYVFVIRGFRFDFGGDDHHLEELAVLEDRGYLTVTYKDEGAMVDDDFWFDLDYAWVPRSQFRNLIQASGSATGHAERSIPAGRAVVRGFHYLFTNGDHHIRDIGVRLPNSGNIEVWYQDQDRNDPFDWIMRIGILN